MSWSFETYLGRLRPNEQRLLFKWSAVYAGRFKDKVFSVAGREITCAKTGEEILGLTLTNIMEGRDGFLFRGGDIVPYYYLCRCCRRTVLDLYRQTLAGEADAVIPQEEDHDTPLELTEGAALQFLLRQQTQEAFLAFVRDQKLRGKLRAYCSGFARYGEENWDEARIAKDLRTTTDKIGAYRARLRDLIEEFELDRLRRRRT